MSEAALREKSTLTACHPENDFKASEAQAVCNVIVAESAGFCFGVERAVSRVYEELEKASGPLYTYGPIIHNETVVADLAARGVKVLDSEEDLKAADAGTLIIRSHGVSESEQQTMEKLGYSVIDATCPFVKKIHHLVQEASEKGEKIMITGDCDHPEVRGICGWCAETPLVMANEEEIPANPGDFPYLLVSQTTFNQNKFNKIVAKLKEYGYTIRVVNTICNATQKRQSEAEGISSQVDTMIVIGGSQSSNTRKLYEICKAHCDNTYHIQTLVDLSHLGLKPVRSVGITAGASTPKKIIEEVQQYVRKFCGDVK